NALGGDERMTADLSTTIVKGIGLELASVGQQEPGPGDEVIVVEGPGERSYRRLVLTTHRVAGATVLGHHPLDLAAATTAVKQGLVLDVAARAAVAAGEWSVLGEQRQPARPIPLTG